MVLDQSHEYLNHLGRGTEGRIRAKGSFEHFHILSEIELSLVGVMERRSYEWGRKWSTLFDGEFLSNRAVVDVVSPRKCQSISVITAI